MAITTVSLSHQAGLEQVIQRADAELATLQVEAEHAEKQIAAAQAELETIATWQSNRFQQLQIAGQTVQTLKEELAAAQARARLSENTLASEQAEASPRDLEKRLHAAQKDFERLQAKLAKESSVDDQREASAQATYSQAQDSLTAISKAQQAITSAREQAHQELGQVIQKAVVQRLSVLKEEVEVRRQSAERAVQEVDVFSREATQRLLEWPALLGQIKPLLSIPPAS